MRDLRPKSKKADLLDRVADFIFTHPFISAAIIIAVEVFVMVALAQVGGQLSRR